MSREHITPSFLGGRLWTLSGMRIARRHGTTTVGTHLATVDREILGSPWLWSPTESVAIVEDACWALARDCWLARKPPLWHLGARRAWRAERAVLQAKRERVIELLDEVR